MAEPANFELVCTKEVVIHTKYTHLGKNSCLHIQRVGARCALSRPVAGTSRRSLRIAAPTTGLKDSSQRVIRRCPSDLSSVTSSILEGAGQGRPGPGRGGGATLHHGDQTDGKDGWPKPEKGGLAMDLNKNREKAAAERKAGANKVLDRVRDETGIDKDNLIWVDSLDSDEPKYRLVVFAGRGRQGFDFSNEGLSDYPTGHPGVDTMIDVIIRWITSVRQT